MIGKSREGTIGKTGVEIRRKTEGQIEGMIIGKKGRRTGRWIGGIETKPQIRTNQAKDVKILRSSLIAVPGKLRPGDQRARLVEQEVVTVVVVEMKNTLVVVADIAVVIGVTPEGIVGEVV